jgi:ferredoxin
MVSDPLFLAYLAQFDDKAWLRAVDRLHEAMHPVDRAATRAWFHFYPLRLQRALESAADPAALADHLRLEGRWRLEDQRTSSHWFLFGHRYWGDVAAAVIRRGSSAEAPGSLDLAAQVQAIARDAAAAARVDPSWLVGIAAVALRTLQQVGLPEPAATLATGDPLIGAADADPDRLVTSRSRRSRGWFSFLRGSRRSVVTFDERPPRRSFPLIASQHLTTAAASDVRDYRREDARCTEGPIPVQCRSCSCGTCWVGILAGADHVSAMEPRERATLEALGYADSPEPRPVIRLACMVEGHGPVTLVIPPWNGQVGVRLEKARARGVEWPTHDS